MTMQDHAKQFHPILLSALLEVTDEIEHLGYHLSNPTLPSVLTVYLDLSLPLTYLTPL